MTDGRYRLQHNFTSRREKIDQESKELFLALDSTDASSQSFLIRCGEVEDISIICNARDKRSEFWGRTLLHNAARQGKYGALKYLISIGHNVNVTDSSVSRITPLMDAVTMNSEECVMGLTEAGANLAMQDSKGENIFHYATRYSGCRIIQGMIKAASLNHKQVRQLASCCNVKNKFPEDVARNTFNRDILINLRQRGYHKFNMQIHTLDKESTRSSLKGQSVPSRVADQAGASAASSSSSVPHPESADYFPTGERTSLGLGSLSSGTRSLPIIVSGRKDSPQTDMVRPSSYFVEALPPKESPKSGEETDRYDDDYEDFQEEIHEVTEANVL